MSYDTLEVRIDERGVASVALNLPERRNALSAALIEDLTAAAHALGGSKAVRAVVLSGAGKVFCAGGDLNWIDPSSLVPEFREVMANTASGQLSEPFKTPYGWHILEVLGRRATDASEEFREQQALSLLRNRKYEEELQNWLRQIRDEAYVEIKI